ncbi:MAG: hypothetical protein WCW01_06265 [Gammaproteobacteria bacterium]
MGNNNSVLGDLTKEQKNRLKDVVVSIRNHDAYAAQRSLADVQKFSIDELLLFSKSIQEGLNALCAGHQKTQASGNVREARRALTAVVMPILILINPALGGVAAITIATVNGAMEVADVVREHSYQGTVKINTDMLNLIKSEISHRRPCCSSKCCFFTTIGIGLAAAAAAYVVPKIIGSSSEPNMPYIT